MCLLSKNVYYHVTQDDAIGKGSYAAIVGGRSRTCTRTPRIMSSTLYYLSYPPNYLVPGTGLEPVRYFRAADFKSAGSTYSPTRAIFILSANKLPEFFDPGLSVDSLYGVDLRYTHVLVDIVLHHAK